MDKFKLNDVVICKETINFCDNTQHHAGSVHVVTEKTIYYYNNQANSSKYILADFSIKEQPILIGFNPKNDFKGLPTWDNSGSLSRKITTKCPYAYHAIEVLEVSFIAYKISFNTTGVIKLDCGCQLRHPKVINEFLDKLTHLFNSTQKMGR